MTISIEQISAARRHAVAKEVLFVPCRVTSLGVDVIVTGHLPDGTPTAIAFTSSEALSHAMGASATWIRLSAHGLRSTLGPRGITHLQVDPDLVAPNPATMSSPAPAASRTRSTLGA